MYRCFISECVAIMNSESICEEISINGDCVWRGFDTSEKVDIDTVINVTAKLNNMIKILNHKLNKKGYSKVSVGMGIDYERALMVKIGYLGNEINDVIWMRDAVNSAYYICNKSGRNFRKQ